MLNFLLTLLNKNKWDAFVKLSSMLMAIVFLIISSQFSVAGFGISVHEKKWVGWAMALGLIVLELIWNRMVKDFESNWKEFPILFFAGLVGYVYGIYTNIVGINYLSGVEIHGFNQFIDTFTSQPIQTCVGIMVEIVPESMLIWAISQKIVREQPNKQQQPSGNRPVREDLKHKLQNHNKPVRRDFRPASKPEPTYHPVSNKARRLFGQEDIDFGSDVDFTDLREEGKS